MDDRQVLESIRSELERLSRRVDTLATQASGQSKGFRHMFERIDALESVHQPVVESSLGGSAGDRQGQSGVIDQLKNPPPSDVHVCK